MTDPASITGLVIALSQAISNIYSYGRAVGGAKSDIARLNTELFALKGVLESFHSLGIEEPVVNGNQKWPTGFQELIVSTLSAIQSLNSRLQVPKGRIGKAVQALIWPLNAPETERQIQHFERIKSSFILILMRGNSSELTETLSAIRQIESDLKEDRLQQQSVTQQSEERSLLEWLSPTLSSQIHAKALLDYHPGTCRWFLEEFESWMKVVPYTSSIVWVTGSSGTGKTTLSARVIEYLVTKYELNIESAVMYHYCSFNDATSQTPASILCKVVAQLGAQSSEILQELKPIFAKDTTLNRPRSITVDHILPILAGHLGKLGKSFLVVDAVNESQSTELIVQSLLRLLSITPKLHIIITSTGEPGQLSFPRVLRVKMDPSKVDKDIAAVITAELETNRNLQRVDGQLKEEIQLKVLQNSNGM